VALRRRSRWLGRRRNRDEEPVTFGEARQTADGEWEHFDYRPGRLVLMIDGDPGAELARAVADALSGLIDLYSGPWGLQLTPIELADAAAGASEIVAEDVESVLYQYAAEQPTHMIGTNEMHLRDEPVEWALDRLDSVLRDAAAGGGILAALIFLFVSHLEFAFGGDEVRHVLGLEGDEDAPASAIDRVRVEESFHNCFKALEAVLGGHPPTEVRKLRTRLIERGIDPDEKAAFAGHGKEAVIDRIRPLQQTRDKRSAHGGRKESRRARSVSSS
jgi:hypothetical protein